MVSFQHFQVVICSGEPIDLIIINTAAYQSLLCCLTVIAWNRQMSRDMTKPTKWLCVHRRLRSVWASTQSDQSSLCAYWVAKDSSFLHVDSEDSDQTGWMPSLNWVFAGHTLILLVLSCRSSNILANIFAMHVLVAVLIFISITTKILMPSFVNFSPKCWIWVKKKCLKKHHQFSINLLCSV